MKEPIVVAQGDSGSAVEVTDNASGWKYLFVLGTGIAVIGLLDVALLFYPAQWASLDWEFGTISSALEGLPLLTIGLGVMSAAAVANGWVLTRRIMVAVLLMMALVVAILSVVFALDVPAVAKAVEPVLRPTVKKASLKTALMAMTYFALYLALGVWTWRRLKSVKGARR